MSFKLSPDSPIVRLKRAARASLGKMKSKVHHAAAAIAGNEGIQKPVETYNVTQ
jgi:hypothetical protein